MKLEDLKKEDCEKLSLLEKVEWLEWIMKDTQKALEELSKYVEEKGW